MNEQIPAKQISVRKASGEHEPYAPEKLADSLRQAGADEELVLQILDDINAWLAEGVSTRKIYARALSLLRRQRQSAHARYRVKDALMELGSSGYPFEVYIGEIFKAQGYEVQTGIVVEGASINHEMDVIATGKGQQLLLECKYTQKQGNHVSIQVPLYVHSRVADIVAKRKQDPALQGLDFIAGVVTNTRFSDDSTRYAKAYGMRLLSWDYPAGNGLKDLIVRDRLYPVTILTTISPGTKELLIREGLVSCGLLAENLDILLQLGLGEKKRRALNCELSAILGYSEHC